MDSKAKILADLIDKRGSRRAFADEIGLPPTTLQSILKRGVGKAAIDNVIKICRALGITVEQLEDMANGVDEPITLAAHHDGEDWTEEELEVLRKFKDVLKSRRTNKE